MNKYEQLPTATDIAPTPKNLDERTALEHFLGKSLEEVYQMIKKSGMAYLYMFDYDFMGDRAFIFYLPVITRYIQSTNIDRNEVLFALDSLIRLRTQVFLEHPYETKCFIKGFLDAMENLKDEDDEDGLIRSEFNKVNKTIDQYLTSMSNKK